MRAISRLRPIVAVLAMAFFPGGANKAASAQAISPSAAKQPQGEHRFLWYAKPARVWSSEALPIGNSRMGAMLFGGVNVERIQFNESSLWSGDNNWDGEYDCGDHGFGSYRNFGELLVEFAASSADVPADYARSLDISTGFHYTAFSRNGVFFTREAFASRPDQVIVVHFSAKK